LKTITPAKDCYSFSSSFLSSNNILIEGVTVSSYWPLL
jgi:hypothetical protein